MNRHPACFFLLVFLLLLGPTACTEGPDAPPDTPATAQADGDLTGQLEPGAGPDAVAAHLQTARAEHLPTRALAINLPDLDRATAYDIQMRLLALKTLQDDSLVGWKMGGTRMTDPTATPDPLFGFVLASDRYEDGDTIAADRFVGGATMVETEVVVYIGADLPGPEVSRDELLAAIEGVGGAIELVSPRLLPLSDDRPESLTTNHLVADGIAHAGFILGTARVDPASLDWADTIARVAVNGEPVAEGAATQIMNSTPIDAVLWLANELPRHGRHLRAGDFILTGGLYDNPTLSAGDRAEVSLSTLDTLSVALGR